MTSSGKYAEQIAVYEIDDAAEPDAMIVIPDWGSAPSGLVLGQNIWFPGLQAAAREAKKRKRA